MPRIKQLELQQVPSFVKRIFKHVQDSIGHLPNLYKILAHSPEALNGFLELSKNIKAGVVEPKLNKAITLAVSELSKCDYCLALHTRMALDTGLLSEEECILSRKREGWDEKTDVMFKFVENVYKTAGKVGDSDLDSMRNVGFSDGEMVEIMGIISMILFSNFIGNLGQADLDTDPAPQII